MTKRSSVSESERILILAPTGSDGSVAAKVLNDSDIDAQACRDVEEICREIVIGAGAVIISEEAITEDAVKRLSETLEQQENWSDLPIILLTTADVVRATELFSRSGNIALLERPFTQLTLVRSSEVALRARRRQYQVRNLLMELTRSKEEAERANLAKTQFLANMSHEIRTPIGAIMGFIDLIKNTEDKTEIQNYTGIIDRNSHQLLALIDDILDLSKVESGKMPIENVRIDLGEFLFDIISMFRFKASEHSLEFRSILDSSIPRYIYSDPVRLKQILSNILGNAIKFTERGYVHFRISFLDSMLKFRVTDSGLGLTPEQSKKLFQPFAQADGSITRRFGGTGLGLALSLRLSQALNGNLKLEHSTPGAGSTFVVDIETHVEPNAAMINQLDLFSFSTPRALPTNRKNLEGIKILLVEDSPDNQMLISLYLKDTGADVTIQSNGEEGMKAALESDFDLVLMDLQMPKMDGHEATKRLRKMNYPKPIIALTAHAMNEEKERCFESGFTEYLTKPIQRGLLLDVLSRYAPITPPPPSPPMMESLL